MSGSLEFLRAAEQAKRNKKLIIARAAFSALFVLTLLILTIAKNEKKQVLAEGECLRDYTFVWTSSINEFFVENTGWKNFLII